ncbi:hypothetical protein BaRGS_00021939 [Batillaria attramentaria]|uniref:Uncharacterized protein n=1 Tax=Batillaria attramentaria TaxID=370345 RepID=A0ABD0KIC8_9CAEN
MRMDEHIKRHIEKYTDEASRLAQHEALKKYTMAYEQAKELGNPFTLRACSANLAAIHIKSGKAEDAEKGLRYLEEAVPPEGKTDGASNGDLYFNMGLACQVLRRFRDASSHFEKAWHEYKSERDNLAMEIDSLKRLVQVSSVRQKHEEVVSWCQKLEEAYERADKPADQLLAMVQRISLQNQLGQDGVREALDECCAIVDRIRNAGLASVGMLVQVSVLLTQCKELERARRYLEEAKDVFEAEDGMSMEKAVVLQNLGTICNYLGDWETSIPYHHEAAEIYRYYAGLSLDPRSPLQPKPAKRCQGHCLANHAYALIQLDKVDEARVLFQDALRLAKESDDMDTKWQMEEALGAVHFRLALHDIENPHDMTADIKVALPESRMEHLHKSLTSYKAALKDLANTSGDKSAMQDRVLEKFTQVQAFTQKATAKMISLQIQHKKERKSHHVPSTPVRLPNAEDDEDDEQAQLDLYRQQLESDDDEQNDQRSNNQKTVRADVHPQHMQYSSSAESGSSETSDDDGEEEEESDTRQTTDDDGEEEEESDTSQTAARNRGPVPPVPTQSPPVTMQASGTYEHPGEMHVNPVYQGTQPSSSVPPASNYAELDFVKKKTKQGESRGEEEGPGSLNFFISSSEEESERTTRQRDPADQTQQENASDSPGYEPVEFRPASAHTHSRAQQEQRDVDDIAFDDGESFPDMEAKRKEKRLKSLSYYVTRPSMKLAQRLRIFSDSIQPRNCK